MVGFSSYWRKLLFIQLLQLLYLQVSFVFSLKHSQKNHYQEKFDFHPKYWQHVAQAREWAKCLAARKDLLVLDFEGVLKYFRVSLPKKYRTVEASNTLIRSALTVKVKKLKKYESDYNIMKENERNYVDPVTRLTMDNKRLMEDIMRYEYTATNLVLARTTAEETCQQLEEELNRTKMSLKEAEDFNARLKEETNSVKELFQKEMKQYDAEGEKKSNIIKEYKQICSKLSSQLEMEQKLSRERMSFFQSNLCATCSNFVSTAINIASSGNPKPNGDSGDSNGERRLEDIVKPLENELAKTKIALAEAECKNDDMNHRLSVMSSELEAYRANYNNSGSTWLFNKLSFNKDHKKTALSHANSLPTEDSIPSSLPSAIPNSFPKK